MTKQHGHEKAHAHCEHCLHFCGHCDVVYCCDCKIEWGKPVPYHYPHQWTWNPYQSTWAVTIPAGFGTVSDTLPQVDFTTSGTSDTVTTTAEACSHVHN